MKKREKKRKKNQKKTNKQKEKWEESPRKYHFSGLFFGLIIKIERPPQRLP